MQKKSSCSSNNAEHTVATSYSSKPHTCMHLINLVVSMFLHCYSEFNVMLYFNLYNRILNFWETIHKVKLFMEN